MSVDLPPMPMVRHGSAYGPSLRDALSSRSAAHRAAPHEGLHEARAPGRPPRDTAGQVLVAMAERALERPPRDLHKLVASASKFLLTNLEPAIELAREVRHVSEQAARSTDTVQLMAPNRNDEVLNLLTREPSAVQR